MRSAHPLRFRLTVLYCLVSVVSSAVLLVIMYALASSLSPGMVRLTDRPYQPGAAPAPPPEGVDFSLAMLLVPGLALAIMAVISLLLGWLIAGRVLRPVLTMTERLHQISERTVQRDWQKARLLLYRFMQAR